MDFCQKNTEKMDKIFTKGESLNNDEKHFSYNKKKHRKCSKNATIVAKIEWTGLEKNNNFFKKHKLSFHF